MGLADRSGGRLIQEQVAKITTLTQPLHIYHGIMQSSQSLDDLSALSPSPCVCQRGRFQVSVMSSFSGIPAEMSLGPPPWSSCVASPHAARGSPGAGCGWKSRVATAASWGLEMIVVFHTKYAQSLCAISGTSILLWEMILFNFTPRLLLIVHHCHRSQANKEFGLWARWRAVARCCCGPKEPVSVRHTKCTRAFPRFTGKNSIYIYGERELERCFRGINVEGFHLDHGQHVFAKSKDIRIW